MLLLSREVSVIAHFQTSDLVKRGDGGFIQKMFTLFLRMGLVTTCVTVCVVSQLYSSLYQGVWILTLESIYRVLLSLKYVLLGFICVALGRKGLVKAFVCFVFTLIF